MSIQTNFWQNQQIVTLIQNDNIKNSISSSSLLSGDFGAATAAALLNGVRYAVWVFFHSLVLFSIRRFRSNPVVRAIIYNWLIFGIICLVVKMHKTFWMDWLNSPMKLKQNLIGFVPLFWCTFILKLAAKFVCCMPMCLCACVCMCAMDCSR